MDEQSVIQGAAFLARWAVTAGVLLAAAGAFALLVKFVRKGAGYSGAFAVAVVFGPAVVGSMFIPEMGWVEYIFVVGPALIMLLLWAGAGQILKELPMPWCNWVSSRTWAFICYLIGGVAGVALRFFSQEYSIGRGEMSGLDHPLRLAVELGSFPFLISAVTFISVPMVMAGLWHRGVQRMNRIDRLLFGLALTVTMPVYFLPICMPMDRLRGLYAGFNWTDTVQFSPLPVSVHPWIEPVLQLFLAQSLPVAVLMCWLVAPGIYYLYALTEKRWPAWRDQFRGFMPGMLVAGFAVGNIVELARNLTPGSGQFYHGDRWALACLFGSLAFVAGAIFVEITRSKENPGHYSRGQLTSQTYLYFALVVRYVFGVLLLGVGLPVLWGLHSEWLNLNYIAAVASLAVWAGCFVFDAGRPKARVAHVSPSSRMRWAGLLMTVGLGCLGVVAAASM